MNLQKIVMALKCNAYAEFCCSQAVVVEKKHPLKPMVKTKETALHSSIVPFANFELQV